MTPSRYSLVTAMKWIAHALVLLSASTAWAQWDVVLLEDELVGTSMETAQVEWEEDAADRTVSYFCVTQDIVGHEEILFTLYTGTYLGGAGSTSITVDVRIGDGDIYAVSAFYMTNGAGLHIFANGMDAASDRFVEESILALLAGEEVVIRFSSFRGELTTLVLPTDGAAATFAQLPCLLPTATAPVKE